MKDKGQHEGSDKGSRERDVSDDGRAVVKGALVKEAVGETSKQDN